ncbi:MAG: hypothetical protein AAEJ04_10500 [Planctomycetota bacterium]
MFHRPWTKPGHGTFILSHLQLVLIASCFFFLTALPNLSEAQAPPIPPAPPTGLTCATDGQFVSEVFLNWTNTEPYDQIAVRRDGTLLEFIGGSLTSYIDLMCQPLFTTTPSTVCLPVLVDRLREQELAARFNCFHHL